MGMRMAGQNENFEEFRMVTDRHDPDEEPRTAGVTYRGGEPVYGNFSVGPYRFGPGSAAEPQEAAEDTPIWLAALMAMRVQASANGEPHAIRWICVSGRALYTNRGSEAELIDPLGVYLERGYTLSVTWEPGETEYTVEVFGGLEHCA